MLHASCERPVRATNWAQRGGYSICQDVQAGAADAKFLDKAAILNLC